LDTVFQKLVLLTNFYFAIVMKPEKLGQTLRNFIAIGNTTFVKTLLDQVDIKE